MRLLWKFVCLIPESRRLELEIQDAFQKMHDISFANELTHGKHENDLAKTEGYVRGIEWCLKRFS